MNATDNWQRRSHGQHTTYYTKVKRKKIKTNDKNGRAACEMAIRQILNCNNHHRDRNEAGVDGAAISAAISFPIIIIFLSSDMLMLQLQEQHGGDSTRYIYVSRRQKTIKRKKRTSNCGTRMSRASDCHEDNKSCLFAYQTSPVVLLVVVSVAASPVAAPQQHVAQN